MEIILGKTAGFCFGVANAVNKTKKELKEKKEICCLGELVHNGEVTKELEEEGLIFINNIEEAKQNVIIRAHGEPIETYEKAKKLNLKLIDLTCPKVIKIHDTLKEYKEKGFFIILIGKKDHPETIGTVSYCKDHSIIIESLEEVEKAIEEINKYKKVLIVSQTTFSTDLFESICKKIKESINKDIEIEIKNTICDATKLRQEETKEIAKKVDLMIIIGGKNSSNTNKLYSIASTFCKKSILIETAEELDKISLKKFKKAGIMAGASTPKKSIKSVVEMLNKV